MLAYIRLVINPRDDEAFKRIVNYPTRGIGDTTVQRIAQLAAERGVSMWEAVDALVAEPAADPVQKTIARKVADFVAMIRSLSLARNEKGLYDFGLEIATRSGILAAYRAENTPEATSALDNIEELLNSMQEFKERCDAEIRNGERPQDEEATIEEWLQNVMLVTDMDKDDPEDRNKVTLMTVHSAKGLEYKYVYIVGLEENLFPSQRAAESPDGMEEERRLFYVALTRAKVEATISYAEMRFKWGNMEFSRPSCFLREIDPKYVRADFGTGTDDDRPHRSPDGSAPSAIDELRRRFDYRFQQKQQAAGGNNGGGRPGSNPGRGNFGGRPSDGESGPARRFARAAAPRDARPQGASRPGARPGPAPLDRRHAPHRCAAGGRRRRTPRRYDARQRRLYRGTARRAPQIRRGYRAAHRDPRHRPQAGRGLRRRGRKDPAGQIRQTDQTITAMATPPCVGLHDHLQPRSLPCPGHRERAGAADLVRGRAGAGRRLQYGLHGRYLPRIRGEIPRPRAFRHGPAQRGLACQLPPHVRGLPREIRGLLRRRRLVERPPQVADAGRPAGVRPLVRDVLYARQQLLPEHRPHRTRSRGALYRLRPPALPAHHRQLRHAGAPRPHRPLLCRGAPRRAPRMAYRRRPDVALVRGLQPCALPPGHHGGAPPPAAEREP